jgi:ankyrin repeat protein
MLLAKGATLNVPPASNGITPLAAASGVNDTALVKFLLEKGGKAVLAPPGGPMALINAAFYGNVELVKLLLAQGVDVNSTSPAETTRVKNGPIGIGSLTPLIISAASGDTEVVRILLQAGARVDAQDVRGMTPLMLALATDHPNRDIVKLLIDKGADTKIKSKAGESALDWALKFKDASMIAAIRAASPGVEPLKHDPVTPGRLGARNALVSIQKSVPLLQKSAATMFKEGGCVSCHAGNIVSSAVAAACRSACR